MIMVMVIGLWQSLAAVQKLNWSELPASVTDFRTGLTTGQLEKKLDQQMPARDHLIAWANGLRYTLLRGSNDQVRTGKDGWLFLTEELKYDPNGLQNMATRVELVSRVSTLLFQKNIQLVVALVPDKARLYQDKLAIDSYTITNQSRYAEALRQMQTARIAVVDLHTPLKQSRLKEAVYYTTDTHWNQTGARLAAQAIAEHVKGLGVPLKKTDFSTSLAATATQRPGDLTRLMGLHTLPTYFQPKADVEAEATTRQLGDGGGAGLFGDNTLSAVLTGTSYSLRGNFHGYLQQSLATQTLNAAQDGSGFFQAIQNYLKDDAFKSSPPVLVVWELPERFLTLPLAQEKDFAAFLAKLR
ncbi:hypothetical protein [Rhodoferax sp.]|uniref:alginate O-acetyltransferase AlgX-related protein n=1 Tax=Rhodoferax sp. TaxID=50421 RepID=UPI00261BA25F|nr:hypothetical protein [Rhodoferax sp.]MDD2923756.1 hypothetical protein [Rhodoferax sp.]